MNLRRIRISVGFVVAVGVMMRVVNAFRYNLLWGFDAHFKWQYIEYLQATWVLPPPERLWSAAHPPLFYYLSAFAVRALGASSLAVNVVALRLVGTALGLATICLAYVLVRRVAAGSRRRALIAAGLLLFLPVHIYTSAMLSEEMLVSFLVSLVLVGLATELTGYDPPHKPLTSAAWLGALAGLALLTKLTGAMVAVAAVATYLLDGWHRRRFSGALRRACLFLGVAGVVGGWFYLRNLIHYGYLYPHGLEIHSVMYTMPPGTRHLTDYFTFPLAIWTDPQVLNPDLLRSVWGSTYVTMWFEGHRAFLPHSVPAVDRAGGALLVLALLPTTAFAIGLARGIRRAAAAGSAPDALLSLLVVLTLTGYIFFTWQNPFFAVCKAGFLLSLSLPFAFYASEALDGCLHKGGRRAAVVWSLLAAGALLVTITFTKTELFWNMDHMPRPGMVWGYRDAPLRYR